MGLPCASWCPVVRIPPFKAGGMGSIPDLRTGFHTPQGATKNVYKIKWVTFMPSGSNPDQHSAQHVASAQKRPAE